MCYRQITESCTYPLRFPDSSIPWKLIWLVHADSDRSRDGFFRNPIQGKKWNGAGRNVQSNVCCSQDTETFVGCLYCTWYFHACYMLSWKAFPVCLSDNWFLLQPNFGLMFCPTLLPCSELCGHEDSTYLTGLPWGLREVTCVGPVFYPFLSVCVYILGLWSNIHSKYLYLAFIYASCTA